MDSSPIHQYAAPTSTHLEPLKSSKPILTPGYELRPVSRGWNHGKSDVRVSVRVWGLRWLEWSQEHKNHAEKTQWFILVDANLVPMSSS